MNNYVQAFTTQAFQQHFDLGVLPFSRFGSYLVMDLMPEGERFKLWIRDIHGGDLDPGCQFALEFYFENSALPLEELDIQVFPTELRIASKAQPEAYVCFCMPLASQLMAKGEGLSLRLTYAHRRYDSFYPLEDGSYELTSYSKEIKYKVRAYKGTLEVDAPWERIGSEWINLTWTAPFEWLLTSYTVVEPSDMTVPTTYDEGLSMVQKDYLLWLDQFEKNVDAQQFLELSPGLKTRMGEAAYILWMNFVRPEGLLKRPAMYMTKHYMTNIWSWDNCFGAIALAVIQPELAWDQLMMFADFQHESGAYPDYANNQYASYSSMKPPIYTWAYRIMCQLNPVFNQEVYQVQFYETISKQTKFWLTERMTALGLPAYRHGNESGWDNGTLYCEGVPIVTPDLAALLICQTEGLAQLAKALGREAEAADWGEWQTKLTTALISHLWDVSKGRFVAIKMPSREVVDTGDSLQRFLPLLAWAHLPKTTVADLMAGLKDEARFLSPFGLATEAKNSEFYQYNGYWRGPIWAPSTLLFIEALKEAGETSMAEDLRDKWLQLNEKSGFYENFDPETGEGLVDPGFAWTAAVFVHLLNIARS